MRAVLQRVAWARVRVDDQVRGEIGPGLLVLHAVAPGDGEAEVRWMADKIAALRIFPDAEGKMNLSVREVGGAILCVSQFTLYADARKGRRPSFVKAAPPAVAEALYLALCAALGAQRGVFGAEMKVELLNDGPVTLILDSP